MVPQRGTNRVLPVQQHQRSEIVAGLEPALPIGRV
jgi:hypothetical protein